VRTVLLTAISLFVALFPARAANPAAYRTPQWEDCVRAATTAAAARIKRCTELIGSISLSPSDRSEAYLRRGHAYLNDGQYTSAVADLGRLLSDSAVPSEIIVEATLQRGVAYAMLGDLRMARADVEMAFNLSSKSPDSNLSTRVEAVRGFLDAVAGGILAPSMLVKILDANVVPKNK